MNGNSVRSPVQLEHGGITSDPTNATSNNKPNVSVFPPLMTHDSISKPPPSPTTPPQHPQRMVLPHQPDPEDSHQPQDVQSDESFPIVLTRAAEGQPTHRRASLYRGGSSSLSNTHRSSRSSDVDEEAALGAARRSHAPHPNALSRISTFDSAESFPLDPGHKDHLSGLLTADVYRTNGATGLTAKDGSNNNVRFQGMSPENAALAMTPTIGGGGVRPQDGITVISPTEVIAVPANVTVRDSAGMKMVKSASGQRLKPATAYRKPELRGFGVNNGGGSPTRYAVADPQKGDQEQGGATTAAGGGVGDDYETSTMFTDSTQTSMNKKSVFGGDVPFWVRVVILMMVPVSFIAIYLGMTLFDATANVTYVMDTSDDLELVIQCTKAFTNERRLTTPFLLSDKNGPDRITTHDALDVAREATDYWCRERLQTSIQKSAVRVMREDYVDNVRMALEETDQIRYGVDRRLLSTADARLRYSGVLTQLNNGITLAARGSVKARHYLQLKTLRAANDRFGLCGGAGVEILRRISWGTLTESSLVEMNNACLDSVNRLLDEFRVGSGREFAASYRQWEESPVAQLAMKRIMALSGLIQNSSIYFPPTLNGTGFHLDSGSSSVSGSGSGSTASGSSSGPFLSDFDPWALDTSIPPPVDFNEATYAQDHAAASALMDQIALDLLHSLQESKQLKTTVLTESLKLSISCVVSMVGIALLARAQRKATSKVEFALSRTRQMSRAVGAFIPRSFLKLMGVDSILSLERGDQTEVSVALVFSDIRNFTGISEHMTNEQLFEWLQAHLTRMTTTTERHRGFVDKFVGDAVSSVFLDCGNAVQCAIRMQAVTDALCFDLIANNQDHLVRIGVGIHYATVGVGVLGNDKHHSCSIVSSEIAVPAQLEALTKEYGARILITEQVAERLKEDEFENRLLGRVRLSKASTKEYQVYEIYNADSLAQKTYKKETGELWHELLELQMSLTTAAGAGEEQQKKLSSPLPQPQTQPLALLSALRNASKKHKVVDPALDVKERGFDAGLPYDLFDMD